MAYRMAKLSLALSEAEGHFCCFTFAMLCYCRYYLASCVHLSVCPFVTCRYCVKMSNCRIT